MHIQKNVLPYAGQHPAVLSIAPCLIAVPRAPCPVANYCALCYANHCAPCQLPRPSTPREWSGGAHNLTPREWSGGGDVSALSGTVSSAGGELEATWNTSISRFISHNSSIKWFL